MIISGCTIGWDEKRNISLRPVSDNSTWAATVENAATIWNNKLDCGFVFVISPTGDHPVELVPVDNWDKPQFLGYLDGDHIRIKDGLPVFGTQQVLLHELGHALGSDHIEGRQSIMNASIWVEITDEDVKVFREILEC